MFVRHELTIDVRYEVACARLTHLVHDGGLHGVSETAYEGGRQTLIRVGPMGDVPGVSKLVRVRALDPVRRGATTTVSLRWEATGLTDKLFPVLDADITLTRHGDDQTRLWLVGSYRPPLGRAGALLDKAIMSRVAAATVRSLIDRLAAALAQPAPERVRADAPRLCPVGEADPR